VIRHVSRGRPCSLLLGHRIAPAAPKKRDQLAGRLDCVLYVRLAGPIDVLAVDDLVPSLSSPVDAADDPLRVIQLIYVRLTMCVRLSTGRRASFDSSFSAGRSAPCSPRRPANGYGGDSRPPHPSPLRRRSRTPSRARKARNAPFDVRVVDAFDGHQAATRDPGLEFVPAYRPVAHPAKRRELSIADGVTTTRTEVAARGVAAP
jgi:hypothetical protein